MVAEAERQKWWDRLDDERRAQIKQAAESRTLDDNGRRALTDTCCPMRPTTVKYDDAPEGYVWQEPLRHWVLLQAWWDRLDESDKQVARRSLEKGYELESDVVQMFTRTHCPVMLSMHGYPPQPDWVVSLPDPVHEFISSRFGS